VVKGSFWGPPGTARRSVIFGSLYAIMGITEILLSAAWGGIGHDTVFGVGWLVIGAAWFAIALRHHHRRERPGASTDRKSEDPSSGRRSPDRQQSRTSLIHLREASSRPSPAGAQSSAPRQHSRSQLT
jgi:hypothetical protein